MKLNFLFFLFLVLFLSNCSSFGKKPTSKQIQYINIINSTASECMMDEFFLYQNNWQKIEGEHGSNGIDGLYIKQKGTTITDVLIAESKYNHSRLGSTQKGKVKQMSKAWIMTKLKIVQKHHSNKANYSQIITHVKNNNYKARLFKVKPQKQNKLLIILHRIKNKTTTTISKTDKTTILLDYARPKNNFDKQMIKAYNRCRIKSIKKWFPSFDSNVIDSILQQSSFDKEMMKGFIKNI